MDALIAVETRECKMKDRVFEVMVLGFTLILAIQLYTLSQVNATRDNVQNLDSRLSYLEGCWCTRMCHIEHKKADL